MLKTLFNKVVKEPLQKLMNARFVRSFNSMITPRQTAALIPARVRPNGRAGLRHLPT